MSSGQFKRPKHGQLRLFVAESDRITTNIDTDSSGNSEKLIPPLDAENNKNLATSSRSTMSEPISEDTNTSASSPNVQNKRAPLTAREKLRAARVLSRYNETKGTATKAAMGSKLLDALKESDKGKKIHAEIVRKGFVGNDNMLGNANMHNYRNRSQET